MNWLAKAIIFLAVATVATVAILYSLTDYAHQDITVVYVSVSNTSTGKQAIVRYIGANPTHIHTLAVKVLTDEPPHLGKAKLILLKRTPVAIVQSGTVYVVEKHSSVSTIEDFPLVQTNKSKSRG